MVGNFFGIIVRIHKIICSIFLFMPMCLAMQRPFEQHLSHDPALLQSLLLAAQELESAEQNVNAPTNTTLAQPIPATSNLQWHQGFDKRPTLPKLLSCTLCNKKYSSQWGLKMHRLDHDGQKKHICNACKYVSNNSSNFKRHLESDKHAKAERRLERLGRKEK